MIFRRRLFAGGVIAALVLPIAMASGQTPPGSPARLGGQFVPVEPNDANSPLLRTPIALNLTDASVRSALLAIARQLGTGLMFDETVMSLPGKVTIRNTWILSGVALRQILNGTNVEIFVGDRGRLVLLRRTADGRATQATATVSGRVTDNRTGLGLEGAMITMTGQNDRRALTDAKGTYHLAGVTPGSKTLVARRLGYERMEQRITVTEATDAQVNFALQPAATILSEMVTTATGERSRIEVGNAIGTIKADSVVQTTLIRNMSDLLTARTPGVVVTNTMGLVGAPSIVRIRGVSSVNLSNDPIIVLDGIRLAPANNVGLATRIGNGNIVPNPTGNTSSNAVVTTRLDDIDPNTIESIDVLRGPSAASLYGTDAAAGVIVIKTKKGVAGSMRFNVLADDGIARLANPLPLQTIAYGHDADGTPDLNCFVYVLLQHGCVQDSLRTYDPLNDPRLTTMGTGTAQNLSANLSGGTEQLREFLSLRLSDAVGMYKLSPAESDRILRMWGAAPPSWMEHPNTEQNITGSSRTNLQVAHGLDLSLTANGIYRNTLEGEPGSLLTKGPPANSLARGYYDTLVYIPGENQRTRSATVAKRGYIAAAGSYTPLSWLILRGTLGGDYTLRTDESLLRVSDCTAILNTAGCPSGHQNSRGETFVTTADLGAQATWAPRDWLSFRTSAGEQLSRTTFYSNTVGNGFQTGLAFGTDLLTPTPVATVTGAQSYSVTENRDESATAGWYLEETMAMWERLFLTAAFRKDVASAFGKSTNDAVPTYPKYSLSWVVSDEPFFPKTSWISSFRLRTAYGHSGQEARQTNVQNNFTVQTVILDGVLVPAIRESAVGNAALRPERTAEMEGGFDLSLFENERLHLEATTYRKLSHDAITSQTLAPSTSAGSWTINLGEVENRGYEITGVAKVLDRRSLGWELTVNATRNINRFVSSNSAALPLYANSGLRNVVGYPLQTVFGRSIIGYTDVNGDGLLSFNEVQFGPQIVAYGNGNPEGEYTYSNAFRLLNGCLQVNANFDQITGKSVSTVRDIVLSGALAQQFYVPGTLGQQAAILQGNYGGFTYFASKSTTVRFAELSITGTLPPRWAAQYARAHSAGVTLAARNLAVWSSSAVKDPNFNVSATDIVTFPNGFGNAALGQPREWTIRINLGF